MHRYYSVKYGWLFGTIGPIVKHTPSWVFPGMWVWFVTDTIAVVAARWEIDPYD